MVCSLYEINHHYHLARALKAAVDKAVRAQDGDVLDCVRLVIAQMAEALRDFDAILTRKIILAKNNG